MNTLDAIMARVLASVGRGSCRSPVVRVGDRDPIPWLLRLSVLIRDDYRCKVCGRRDASGRTLQLDHCLPWSTGGTDDSDNLRVLCRPCNQRRSNFDDGASAARLLPTTWWCRSCWSEPSARAVWIDGTDLGAAPAVRGADVLAFCAWCRAEDFTDQPLTADYARGIA